MKASSGQVAVLLGVSVQRVGELARDGALPYEPTPLGRLYRLCDVTDLQRARRIRARRDRRVKVA